MAGILRAGMIIVALLLGWLALVHVANAQPADCMVTSGVAQRLALDVVTAAPPRSAPLQRGGAGTSAVLGLDNVPASGTVCQTIPPRPVQDVLRGAPDAEMLKLQP